MEGVYIPSIFNYYWGMDQFTPDKPGGMLSWLFLREWYLLDGEYMGDNI